MNALVELAKLKALSVTTEPLYTETELARRLGVHHSTIVRWRKAGKITPVYVSQRGTLRVRLYADR